MTPKGWSPKQTQNKPKTKENARKKTIVTPKEGNPRETTNTHRKAQKTLGKALSRLRVRARNKQRTHEKHSQLKHRKR